MTTQISAHNVKELRNKTGAGMMDCKKALQASEGNMEIAIETLHKKGLASADKKSTRIAAEGIIESYIHIGSRIGVLIELNCETDFVARRIEFRKLAKDLAMQIAACQNVSYLSISDIPKQLIDHETRIEMDKEDIIDKPSTVKKQIIKGRLDKRLKEMSLMNQAFIKNPNIIIEDLIKQHIALLGENIKISRFQKFLLGESIQNK
uniref:Elongation factor Ts, mitochondrial n=2 Tax=Gracilariopsis TaxID=2781 RepID=A0A1C9CEU7_9FLOR|nr:elongation factor Ts [Gracilariopsis lemaneiformis]YP_009294639.1 elongation factor Ts [Gracilariopsis chorda]AJO68480.1 elongation factor Ts [Gracilariopsis lemaneiformis]AML79936.1 elongation factor Ts [Gracilariopsis lemaneiformis]AOM66899.1 elongation factor Ts [Gracilariopsis chorda]UAD88840.1 translation elongation factor Ts [Gracilariopsis chorda]